LISPNGLSDADKQAWTKRMAEEPGFRDALILESYITIKAMEAMAAQVAEKFAPLAAQLGGGMLGKALGLGGNGNGGPKEG
jgi:hypothetical protein